MNSTSLHNSYVIIVAGGSGSRMGGALPKQFLEIKNKPILFHTIERFITYSADIQVILVLPKDGVVVVVSCGINDVLAPSCSMI